MKSYLFILVLAIVSLTACKNGKKTQADSEATTKQETTASAEASDSGEKTTKKAMMQKADEPASKDENDVRAERMRPGQDPEQHKPTIADDLYFGMYRTPCFGQCPTYNLDINISGEAILEGIRFFDYEGFHAAQLTEDQMDQITSLAKKYGYFELNHVYDAPVTDLPSTTTVLRTETTVQWVYNRMDAPQELRTFEQEVETLIKDLQWKPIPNPNQD